MARLLQRPRSPFFYVEYKTVSGIRRESTKFRHGTRDGLRAANRILNQRAAQERALAAMPKGAAFAEWVIPFVRQHCTGHTLRAYLIRWNSLSLFLRKRGILYPQQLTYRHCREYLDWRVAGTDLRAVTQNTARDDLSTLGLIIAEAVRRELAPSNPCSKLRIKATERRVRKEIPDSDIAKIREELAGKRQNGKPWPDWMRVQFEIGYYTGRRISETRIALRDLDLEQCTYTVRVKGGKVKTKPFHPGLLPTLQSVRGQEWTHTVSASYSFSMWRELFDKLAMTYDFHCLRVSFVSRCRRCGIDRWTAMQLADHATALIHALYNRYGDADLRSALAKLEFPKLTGDSSE